MMKFASLRLVTNDIERLIAFYTRLTGRTANRLAPEFAEFRADGFVLAISSEGLIARFNAGAAVAAANRSAMIEFEVDDVDAVLAGQGEDGLDIAMAPADMPWGNRWMLLRDPDGNVVNIFARKAA